MHRILIVSHGLPPEATAGTEQITSLTGRELTKRGYEVGFFVASNQLNAIKDAHQGATLFTVPRERRAALWQDLNGPVRRAFRRALRAFLPDVVYFHHTLRLSYDLPLIAKRSGARVAFMLHDFWLACPRSTLVHKDGSLTTQIDRQRCATCLSLSDHPEAAGRPLIKLLSRPWLAARLLRRRDRLEKAIYQEVDVFISPSKTVAAVFGRRGIPPEKMHVVPYGLLELTTDRQPSPKIRFGFIGSLVPHKGAAWLIETFANVDPAVAELTIWGPLEKPTELAPLRDHPHIRYAGPFPMERTSHIYSQIDCLIVPSRWPENQPLVILQAWQAGIPVIAGSLGGMAEAIKPEHNGLLFNWADQRDLLHQIQRFVEDANLRHRLAIGAAATPVITIEQHVDDILPLLDGQQQIQLD